MTQNWFLVSALKWARPIEPNDPNEKSAATSRAWPRPLPGAFLIPPALLLVADYFYELNEYSDRKHLDRH
ncbi:MAG: hypothetical protein WCB15_25270 [Desulfobacterales bacterium]